MRIGILTYHRSQNYGALLQAIALRHVLADMGHDVYFVDYWPEYHKQMYALFSIKKMLRCGFKGAIGYVYRTLKFYRLRKLRIKKFKSFIKEQIEPYCMSYSSDCSYDILIYGSDQIWRKQPTRPKYFNPVYFGDNIINASSHISYAASMGNVVLDENDKAFIKRNLSRFKKLSFREEQLTDTLKELGLNATTMLDPTMLLGKEQWEKLLPIPQQNRGKYILYYRLLEKSFDEEQIMQFANKMGHELIILDSVPCTKGKEFLSTSSPYEFLSLIKHAELVFTSSYHGLAFSLVFNKPFYASFSTNEERAKSLLDKLGLQDRLLKPNSVLSKFEGIDYSKINDIIDSLRSESLEFLSNL